VPVIKTKVKRQIKTLLLISFIDIIYHALMKFKDIDQIKAAISKMLE
jgi:hypothetical protein